MRPLRYSLVVWMSILPSFLLGQSVDKPPALTNVIAVVDGKGSPGFTSLKLDSAGNPVISYSTEAATGLFLRVAHCGNPTCTLGNVITTGDRRHVETNTTLALNATGNPVVAYYFGDAGVGISKLKMLFCQDPNCASNTTIVADSLGQTGIEPSVAIDGSGNPVVSYDAVGAGLKVLHCGDPTCSTNNVDTVVGGGAPNTGGLVLDASGNPVIVIVGGGELGLEHCGNPNCSSGNSLVSNLANLGLLGVFGQSSLALDEAGNPVITYIYQGNSNVSNLHLLHCGSPDCGSGNVDTDVDDNAGNQTVTSLVLDAKGDPVISYSTFNLELGVLHCGDANCTSGNTFATPDGNGLWSSIALDAQGRPVVSYATLTTPNQLRVLHCATSTCQ